MAGPKTTSKRPSTDLPVVCVELLSKPTTREPAAHYRGSGGQWSYPFYGAEAPARFFGLRDWHTRRYLLKELLKELLEGTAFTPKGHVQELRSDFEVTWVRLTRGGSRSELWSQMFADALDTTAEVSEADEARALGTAVYAGIGTDVYSSLDDTTGRVIRLLHTHEPEAEAHDRLAEADKDLHRSGRSLRARVAAPGIEVHGWPGGFEIPSYSRLRED